MATNRTRKRRGAKTARLVAEFFRRHGWPYAEDVGAGRPGVDILGVPGLAIEVKARRDLRLPAWLRQAGQAAEDGGGLAIVIHRPDGFGPASIDDWPATLRLADLVHLLGMAGYGDAAIYAAVHGATDTVPAPPPLNDNRSLGEF